MSVIDAKQLKKEFEGRTLFENVDFEIAKGERAALFGRNGVGKTTLLNGLLGRLAFDGGSVHCGLPRDEWGVLEQGAAERNADTPALDFALAGDAERDAVRRQLAALTEEAQGGVPDDDWLARYAEAADAYERLRGYEWEREAEQTMRRLGIAEALWALPYRSLSGGQKTRLQLARLVVRKPKLLVLDEPTNHLDQPSLVWLEEWLRGYDGTVLMVSHDRTFLDHAATQIIELRPDGCKTYRGGYEAYRRHKQLERQTQEALYRKQEQEKQQLMESIRRYQQWFQAANDVNGGDLEVKITKSYYKAKALKNVTRLHSKEKELERLEAERVDKPRDPEQLRVEWAADAIGARIVLACDNVRFGYGNEPLFDKLNWTIRRGDKWAVIGPNGVGKSTLVKLLTGELEPDSGTVRRHPSLKLGYFSQELDGLPERTTVLDCMLDIPGMTMTFARTLLGCFLFSGDDAFKRIADLSMGERCRVAFLRLYFGKPHVIVMDEPTNYLDIDTRERMEDALAAYEGTLVIVSHDRTLLRKVAERCLVLSAEGAEAFPGSYLEWEARANASEEADLSLPPLDFNAPIPELEQYRKER